ncbi:MAG: TetR/AcrR family transcriptional regulator [Phycisphaerales bacterium]|nr:TetR/AcrR family transcriptional regulator [Phycisphaerales bacterium]
MSPAETRDRILDAAMRLFYEQGFHNTGVATILREAGVNSGSMYHFFDSKDALLKEVLETYVDMLEPMVMRPAEEAAVDPIARVFALLEWYRAGLEANACQFACPIGQLALEIGHEHKPVRTLIDLNFRNWAAHVKGWLDDAGDRLPPGTDTARLSRFVLTVMEGGQMQAKAAGSLKAYDESVLELRRYFDLLLERGAASPRAAVPKRARRG